MKHDNELMRGLPPAPYKKIGVIAGEILMLGRPVGIGSVRAAIVSYPNKASNVGLDTCLACWEAARQIIEEEKKKVQDAKARVQHTLATVPVS